jgi:hypothetical protein
MKVRAAAARAGAAASKPTSAVANNVSKGIIFVIIEAPMFENSRRHAPRQYAPSLMRMSSVIPLFFALRRVFSRQRHDATALSAFGGDRY